MSLPTRIIFLDSDKHTIATEHYNAGWWVPDDVGREVARLYRDEAWTYVVAYSCVYNREGYPVGSLGDGCRDLSNIKWLSVANQRELKDGIDNPPTIVETKTTPSSIKIPMTIRPLPTLLIEDLVGVQPMAAPGGQIFSMKRVTASDEPKRLSFTK